MILLINSRDKYNIVNRPVKNILKCIVYNIYNFNSISIEYGESYKTNIFLKGVDYLKHYNVNIRKEVLSIFSDKCLDLVINITDNNRLLIKSKINI